MYEQLYGPAPSAKSAVPRGQPGSELPPPRPNRTPFNFFDMDVRGRVGGWGGCCAAHSGGCKGMQAACAMAGSVHLLPLKLLQAALSCLRAHVHWLQHAMLRGAATCACTGARAGGTVYLVRTLHGLHDLRGSDYHQQRL